MSLAAVFERLRPKRELALIPYLTGGFPTLPAFLDQLRRVSDSGADIIEIGIPFSDPMADGPTIQYASHVALENGATLRRLLEALARLKLPQPLAAMTYLNPLLAIETGELLALLRAAGIAGLIIPDLPVDESVAWRSAARGGGLSLIQLAAPTSPDERLREIGTASEGFIYVVSLAGTTGARADLPAALPAFLERLRRATATPLAVGFGISRPEHIRFLHGRADGAVVGSRLVDAIRAGEPLAPLIGSLKSATRS